MTKPRVVQYYAQWAIYARDFWPKDLKLDELTNIHYAFFEVTPQCHVASIDEYADFQANQEAAGQMVAGSIITYRHATRRARACAERSEEG